MIKKMYNYNRQYLGWQVLGLLVNLFFVIGIVGAPFVTQYLIDEIIPAEVSIKQGIVFFMLVCSLKPVMGFFKDIIYIFLSESISENLQKQAFGHVITTDYKNYESTTMGNILSVIINDGGQAGEFLSRTLASIIRNGLMILFIIGGMFYISPQITAIVLGIFILVYIINGVFGKKLKEMSLQLQKNKDNVYTSITQNLSCLLSIKTYGKETDIINKCGALIHKQHRDSMRINSIAAFINNSAAMATVICQAIIYGMGLTYVINGAYTIGNVMALILYFQLLEAPFYEIMNVKVNMNINIPVMHRIEEMLKLPEEKMGNCEELIINNITVKNLYFSYEKGREYQIKNINLDFPEKGLVCIQGESGSGKSTFCKILLGIYKKERGEIFFGNRKIEDISLATLRNNISYIPQRPEIFNETYIQNIDFGEKNVKIDEIIEICKRLNIHEKIINSPKGYDTVLSEKAEVSGGEEQRIVIARALVKNSPIIIMDEPFSALDGENIALVSRIVNLIAKEKLVILVTHVLPEDLRPDALYKFEKGEIVND